LIACQTPSKEGERNDNFLTLEHFFRNLAAWTSLNFALIFSHTTGWTRMKLKLHALALTTVALMAQPTISQALPTEGETFVCRVTVSKKCPDSYYDFNGGTTKSDYYIPNTTYKSVQWIGSGRSCTTTGGCTTTFGKITTGTVAWKAGIKVSANAGVKDVAAATAEVNYEYGKTTTDSDILSETVFTPNGYTTLPYSYIFRGAVLRTYKGVWVRGNGYSCGAFGAYRCYKYTWTKDAIAYQTNYNVHIGGGGQLFDFHVYASGPNSGLYKDNDD
jgi:hypothetical protein